jgi:hypothetical protein
VAAGQRGGQFSINEIRVLIGVAAAVAVTVTVAVVQLLRFTDKMCLRLSRLLAGA